MRCTNCQSDNEFGKYCTACGHGLLQICQHCQEPHPARAHYCSQCGRPLEPTDPFSPRFFVFFTGL